MNVVPLRDRLAYYPLWIDRPDFLFSICSRSEFIICSFETGPNRTETVMSAAVALATPTPAHALENEVLEALQLCGGDPMKALRVTLIANAFLEARIDQLTTEVSAGYARRTARKSTNKHGGA